MKMRLFSFTAALAVLSLFTACNLGSKEKKENIIGVRTISLNNQSYIPTLNYIGVIEEDAKINVSFKVQGTVKEVNVSEGEYVRKGDLLASMDLLALQQNYNVAKATLAQAEDAYKRMKIMYDNESLPEIKFVEVKTGLEQAKSSYIMAEDNLKSAKLFAPVNGVIGKRHVEKGENVMSAQTMFTILDIGSVKAKISVPENEIPLIKSDSEVVVNIPVLESKQFIGTVTEKGIDGNKLTHTYDVKIKLNNSDLSILPGMLCNISVEQENSKPFILPNNSVQIGAKSDRYVWCIKDGKATAVRVVLGELTATGVTINSGLTNNDVVIVEGMHKISEGMKVREL